MTLRLRCSTIRSNERFSKSLEINKRAFLVGTHKSTISSDIRRSRTPPLSCGPKTYHADRHRDHTPNNSRSPHAPAKRFRLSLVTSVAALLKASTSKINLRPPVCRMSSGGVHAQNAVEHGAGDQRCRNQRQGDELCAGHVLASGAIMDCGVHNFCSNSAIASRTMPMTSVTALGSISNIAATKKITRSNHVAVRRK